MPENTIIPVKAKKITVIIALLGILSRTVRDARSAESQVAFLDSTSYFALKSMSIKKQSLFPSPKAEVNSRLQMQDLKQKTQIRD